MFTAADIEAMRKRLAATLQEYAFAAIKRGDWGAHGAFELAAQFVLAESVRRCYHPIDEAGLCRTPCAPLSKSEPEVDVSGFPG